jgi:tetratricopeptide (TPR) repeat protein
MTKLVKTLTVACSLTIFSPLGINQTLATPASAWKHFYDEGEHALFIGDFRTAEQNYGLALEMLKSTGDHSLRLKFTLEKLTRSYLLDNNLNSAEQFYGQLKGLMYVGSSSTKLDQVFMVNLKELANGYERKWNRYHDQKCLEHSIELLQVASGDNDAKSCELMITLAQIYVTQGELKKATDLLRQAVSISEKRFGKNPNGLPDMLDRFARDCEKKKNYGAAEQLELEAIKSTKASPGASQIHVPAYFEFLATNNIAQEKNSWTAKLYHDRALSDYAKLKTQKDKESAQQFVGLLVDLIQAEKCKNSFHQPEAQLRELLSLQLAISSDPRCEYGTYNVMSTILEKSGNYQESEKCLLRTIEIAKLPHSCEEKDVPDLYLRLALLRWDKPGRMRDAERAFGEALAAEPDKNGFHSGLVLLYWGCKLRESGSYIEASEKLETALQKGLKLPPEKRGTLVADSLLVLSAVAGQLGNEREKQSLFDQSAAEVRLQKRLNPRPGAGPDFFHRV